VPIDVGEKSAHGQPEGFGDADDIQEPEVSLAPLDAPEVSPVHRGAVREFLLRHAEPFALCAHSAAEALEVRLAQGAMLSA
jgi:hypothetical protein